MWKRIAQLFSPLSLRKKIADLEANLESESAWAYHYHKRAEEANQKAFYYQDRYQRLGAICIALLAYRDRNTLNFQLEKADDFLNQIRILLDHPGEEESET